MRRQLRKYSVSDGKIVLTLEEAGEGGFVVTSPMEPELVTEAESVAEAFENARDALKELRRSRASLFAATSRRTRNSRHEPA
jgi:hypothetical protein